MYMTESEQCIRRSVLNSQIITVGYTSDLRIGLDCASEDSADNGDILEFWGTDSDGSEWRVHLRRQGCADTILVVGVGRSELAAVRNADSDPENWDLAKEYMLKEVESMPPGESWVVLVSSDDVLKSELDGDHAVVAYYFLPG